MSVTSKRTPPPGAIYLRARECADKAGIHPITWWRWVREGRAPQAYRLTAGCTRWLLSEVEEWLAARPANAGEPSARVGRLLAARRALSQQG
jgi:predicted DNA-binding transcriptional regulator AlpA